MLEQDIFVIFLQNQTKIRLRRSAPPKCASLKRYPKCLHDCSPNLIFRKTMRCGTGHFDQRPVLIGFQAYFFVRVVSLSSRDDQQPKVQYYQYFIHTFQKHFLKAPFLKEWTPGFRICVDITRLTFTVDHVLAYIYHFQGRQQSSWLER